MKVMQPRGAALSHGLLLALCLSISTSLWAAEDDIEIVKVEGDVQASEAADKSARPVAERNLIPSGSTVATGANGRAVVRVAGTGVVVLEKNSKIEIVKKKKQGGFFRQITGMIYYALNTIKSDQDKVTVRTQTATIGVRGTRFMVVDLPERNEIGMRKGEVGVESPEGEFEIHRKAEQDEFEAFKQEGINAIAKEKKEFEEFQAKQAREFIEYKREFSLGANQMASFDGKRVDHRPLSEEAQNDLRMFESYADAWLEEVKD